MHPELLELTKPVVLPLQASNVVSAQPGLSLMHTSHNKSCERTKQGAAPIQDPAHYGGINICQWWYTVCTVLNNAAQT